VLDDWIRFGFVHDVVIKFLMQGSMRFYNHLFLDTTKK